MTNLQHCVDGLGSSLLNICQDNLVSMETVCHRGSHDSDGKFKQVLVFRLDGPTGNGNWNSIQLNFLRILDNIWLSAEGCPALHLLHRQETNSFQDNYLLSSIELHSIF